MATGKSHNIDDKWSHEPLVDLIGFQTKPGNRIKTYLESHGMFELSLRDFMDLFLPPASDTYMSEDDFWRSIPILKQPQFGPYLYDSALLSLTEAELGDAFRAEWMLRIYSLKLHELRHRPGNERLYQAGRQVEEDVGYSCGQRDLIRPHKRVLYLRRQTVMAEFGILRDAFFILAQKS